MKLTISKNKFIQSSGLIPISRKGWPKISKFTSLVPKTEKFGLKSSPTMRGNFFSLC